ncbi:MULTISPECIES: universal stress protein [unclassified Microbacterium]|uniref:universal stress protein n=1 Tax=unclassified Microbacterium TaxID=2609290 RepID=UPI001ACF1C2E|nr:MULTISPECIES: universal stress protein [unclassified Microbacterium]MBN9159017.1 universal stress protein [Microbacterium sp.]MBS1895852.1 universal stress protein [Actinomycetota bacterium]MBS1901277.1 universal stress protein [Actinomycetota bacterium]
MTYLVGYGPHNNDRSAIELACQFARSEPQHVRAVSVVPQGWGNPLAGGTDREFEDWAAGEGEITAEEARADLAQHPGIDGTAVWVSGRSVPQALIEQATEHEARMLVVGSSGDAEPGRIRLSSKTDRLVHSSPIPVAIAPRGYRTDSGVTRVTVAFRDDDASWSLLTGVAEICRRTGARLRVVTFVVAPPRRPVTSRMGHAETQVIDLWRMQAGNAQHEAEEFLRSQGFDDDTLTFTIAEGSDWARAIRRLDWEEGDILAIGSSSTHPIARVFLGSSAAKIIRYAPVPVVAVPGAATAE